MCTAQHRYAVTPTFNSPSFLGVIVGSALTHSALWISVVFGVAYFYLFLWLTCAFFLREPVTVMTVVQTLSRARCSANVHMPHSNKHTPVIAADWWRRSRHMLL